LIILYIRTALFSIAARHGFKSVYKLQLHNKLGRKAHKAFPAYVDFESYLNKQIRRFHTWQAGYEGTLIAFLLEMINHTWQAMHRGTLNAKSEISLSGNIPNPLTIS